jgi:hypothetical protein
MTKFSVTFNRAAAAAGEPRHWDIWAHGSLWTTVSGVHFTVRTWTEYDPATHPPARIACFANRCDMDTNGHAVFS